MGENVPVRCPDCGHVHQFTAAAYPCPCGSPVSAPLVAGTPATRLGRRSWDDEWVTVSCTACGRQDQWPRPELGCHCGAVLRIPVRPVTVGARHDEVRAAAHAAASYLRGIGFTDVIRSAAVRPDGGAGPDGAARSEGGDRPGDDGARSDDRPATTVDLRAPGLVAQVDTGARPVEVRAVECLWLNALSESAVGAFFSPAGYADEARERADALGVPLFVLGPTGAPRPVNGPAAELGRSHA